MKFKKIVFVFGLIMALNMAGGIAAHASDSFPMEIRFATIVHQPGPIEKGVIQVHIDYFGADAIDEVTLYINPTPNFMVIDGDIALEGLLQNVPMAISAMYALDRAAGPVPEDEGLVFFITFKDQNGVEQSRLIHGSHLDAGAGGE